MSDDNPTRRPPSTFLLDHGSTGYQVNRSSIDPRWIEVTLEDDEVEVTIVTTPVKMLGIGLTMAAMVSTHAFDVLDELETVKESATRIEAMVTRIEAMTDELRGEGNGQ